MKKNNRLDDILNELRKEVVSETSFDNIEDHNYLEKNMSSFTKPSKDFSSHYNANLSKFNVVWAENKETLLFLLLSSIIVIIIGLLSGYDYIIIVGLFSFAIFSVLIFLTFFKYINAASSKVRIPEDFLRRVDTLERRVEFLSKKEMKSANSHGSRVEKLEEEVREMKLVVKSLIDSIKKS